MSTCERREKMSNAKVWVNPSFQEKPSGKGVHATRKGRARKYKREKGKKAKYVQREKLKQAAQNPIVTDQTPTLLEAITHFSKQIDLGKIKNQVTEVNQIMNQVSGVIQQLQSLSPQSNYRQYYQPYPYVTGQRMPTAPTNPGYQHFNTSGQKH